MIVTTGKMIIVESGRFTLKCDARTPGKITLSCRERNQSIDLPGSKEDSELLIKAYKRILDEDVGYSQCDVES
jgi:hypothetical protein